MRKAIKGFLQKNSEELREINEYFSSCIDTIDKNNLFMLRRVNMYISLVYIAMLVLAVLITPDFRITFAYWIMIPFLGIYFVINRIYATRTYKIPTFVVSVTCLSFYFFLCMIFIMMDVVSFPTQQALWFPLILVVFPVVFIDRQYKYGLEETFMLIVFGIFSYRYKSMEGFMRDIYSVIAAYVISLLCARIILGMRCKEALAMEELKRISSLDKLTHVLNKGALIQAIDNFYMRNPGSVCSIGIIDVDNFKHVNDSLGHNSGDLLLEQVGKFLISNFRSVDIIGRFGGDEFVVFAPNLEDRGLLEMRFRSMQMLLTDFYIGNNEPFSLSIGTIIDKGGHGREEIFRMADDALYKSKLAGKNTCTFWTVNEDAMPDKRMLLLASTAGLDGGQELLKEEKGRFNILRVDTDDEALMYISQYHDFISLIVAEISDESEAGALVIRYTKTRESFADIPILAVATSESAMAKAKSLGADKVLLSGDSPELFKAAILDLT